MSPILAQFTICAATLLSALLVLAPAVPLEVIHALVPVSWVMLSGHCWFPLLAAMQIPVPCAVMPMGCTHALPPSAPARCYFKRSNVFSMLISHSSPLPPSLS
ncbi:hypothetical protein TRVL_07508 [Trypanosoma vivax]|nr:hypothetical protein TRVL_07508 [Trypanosoma vivax]